MYSSVFLNHGIYVPQGIINSVSQKLNIPVKTWNTAYRRNTFIFSHGDTYHHTLMNESVSNWEELELDEKNKKKLVDYIASRASGTNDWIKFNEGKGDGENIASKLHLDLNKPVIGLLTNVAWDAQLHYPANAFSNMIDWIIFTVEYFMGRPDLQLLIRVHPAELTGHLRSRQLVTNEIKKAFPNLTSNIFIIDSNNPANTYEAMKLCNSVIIYGTKMGVELSTMGLPVIVAGEAWIRNKGITNDIINKEDYLEKLNSLPIRQKLSKDNIERAVKYAYHFFYRRMIPVSFLKDTGGVPKYMINVKGIKDLEPGNCKGFDTICNGILYDEEFIYKDENIIN